MDSSAMGRAVMGITSSPSIQQIIILADVMRNEESIKERRNFVDCFRQARPSEIFKIAFLELLLLDGDDALRYQPGLDDFAAA